MSGTVRPLHLLGDHALRSIEERVACALDDWCREWVRDSAGRPEVRAEAVSAETARPSDCLEMSCPGGRVWIRQSPDDLERLAGSVLGAEFLPLALHGDAWSRAALSQAVEQRHQCLAEALIGEVHTATPRAPDPMLFAFASGGVQITCAQLGVHLLADSAVLQHVPPRLSSSPPLEAVQPLLQSARAATVTVSVSLGSAELDLTHLLELQPGDVIRLPTRLEERLPVLGDGHPIAQGSLGHCVERRAVQLVSLPSKIVK